MFYNLTIILPCTICLLWAILLFSRKKSNTKSQKILAWCMLIKSFFFLICANFMIGITDYHTAIYLDVIYDFIRLAFMPIMYLFFKSLTSEARFNWKDFLWFVPMIVVGVCQATLYMMMGEADAVTCMKSYLGNPSTLAGDTALFRLHYFIGFPVMNVLLFLECIGVMIYTALGLVRYHRRLEEFYSDLDDKSIETNYKVFLWFGISLLFSLSILFIGRTYLLAHPTLTGSIFLGWGATYFGLCYSTYNMKYSVENFAKDIEQADQEENLNQYTLPSKETSTADSGRLGNKANRTNSHPQLLEAFNKLIEEDHIFLQKHLRIDDLSRSLHTNRTYVFRMLKEEYDCSFSEYINQKRIEYAKKLMLSTPEKIRQNELADKSGFSSSSTFCRTFKQINGVSPREWLKRVTTYHY